MGINKEFYIKCREKEFGGFFSLILHPNHSKIAVRYIRMVQLFSSSNNIIYKIITRHYLNKLVTKYGIFIHPDSSIGLGLKLPHPNGIVIGKAVKIGENVTIYQQVTIGSSNIGDWKNNKQPIIENGVVLFSGSKIIGDITIASNTVIGANAVVTHKIEEPNQVYCGVPAKKIKSLT